MQVSKRYILKAINDEESKCSVCGKTHLKRVMWIEDVDAGEVMNVGTTCGRRLLGVKNIDKWVQSEIDRQKKELTSTLEQTLEHKAYAQLAKFAFEGGWDQATKEQHGWTRLRNRWLERKQELIDVHFPALKAA
jgi:hypothetical protein